MKQSTLKIIDNTVNTYPILDENRNAVIVAVEILCESYKKGGKLLICGNGGSASDALHIVGELMKDFCIQRPLGEDMKKKLSSVSENAELLPCLGGFLFRSDQAKMGPLG